MFKQGHGDAAPIKIEKILLRIPTDFILRVCLEVIHSFIHSGTVLDVGRVAVNKMDQPPALVVLTLCTAQADV